MSQPAKPRRQNRTITVDFLDVATYHQLCGDGPGFIDFVVAFILSIGFQLTHKCDVPFWAPDGSAISGWEADAPFPLCASPP